MEKLEETKSFCPICLDIVKSEVAEKNGKVYLEIFCPKHGKFENLHKWDDSKYYKIMSGLANDNIKRYPTGLLIDTNYDCNQHCHFCFAEANERKEKKPATYEILEKTKNFKGIYIFLSGGEPTLRNDLLLIIKKLKKKGFRVILATNGKKLIDLHYVRRLKKVGLDIVQLQFDTLDDSQYEIIRGERLTQLRFRVINNLKKIRIAVYLWISLIKGINDNQIGRIISFAAQNSSIIKTIFFVPVWLEGRVKEHNAINAREIIEIIEKEYKMDQDSFIEYAKFDYYLSSLYQVLTKMPFFRYQPCTVGYQFLYIDKSAVPLSKIVNLKKINYYLEKTSFILKQRNTAKKLIWFCKVIPIIFLKDFIINKKLLPFTLMLLRTLFLSIFFKSHPIIKGCYSLQIRIESIFDRYDTDFNMLKHCNLYAYHQNEFIPFCQREIIRKK
jgi:hypothetical protein